MLIQLIYVIKIDIFIQDVPVASASPHVHNGFDTQTDGSRAVQLLVPVLRVR